MKISKWLVVAILASFSISAIAQETGKSKEKKEQTAKTTYVCPMHKDVTSTKPGKCSRCGMDLVAVGAAEKEGEVCHCKHGKDGKCEPGCKCGKCMNEMKNEGAVYVCPMHPDQTSDKPGKCAKCGMDLKKKEMGEKDMAEYYCPMHKDVTSNKPGKCSKCGMDLKKKD
jgi:hypothetical protein